MTTATLNDAYVFSEEYALEQDRLDPLKNFRRRFHIPQHQDKDVIYFCGNSLGLQPRTVKDHILSELDDWARHGVEGHFRASLPWFSYHEILTRETARLVGALPEEVVVMNQLTVNLHLLMVSFYRPTPVKYKILCEAKAFPSDQYALETQVVHHGFDPADAIIEVSPREGEHLIHEEDIISAIEKHAGELALVLIGGVNYFTGQAFNMQQITAAAHKAGAYAGFDLAHAAGNLVMDLHNWGVDFASWCTYKYLNSGPGSVAGVFIHSRHTRNTTMPRFAGWWGHDKNKRFLMEKGFAPIPTAEGWALSNAPVLSMAAHKASLDIFDEAGIEKLAKKRDKLTGYLEYILDSINESLPSGKKLEIITPRDKRSRGAQLSVIPHGRGKELFHQLNQEGVIADWREPNVIRLAPVPLYNSYSDIYYFGEILKKLLHENS